MKILENSMQTICISKRNDFPEQLKIGDHYQIDRCSIWNDSDGDTYGTVYDYNGNVCGDLKLNHFKSINMR